MGLGEKLKDIYYSGEEQWYNFWDKIDSHVPVYKIIDPIDAIVPSFALFLILIFIVLLLLGNMMFGAMSTGQTEINVTVVDNSGNVVEGATVKIVGIDQELTTNTFGLTEKVLVNYGQINVTATKDDKKTTDNFLIEPGVVNPVQLTLPYDRIDFAQKSIMFKTESGDLATGELALTFACSSGTTLGVPDPVTIYGGTVNVAQPGDCGTLTVSVSSPIYTSDTFTLSGASGNFVLTEKVAKTQVKAVVNLTYEGKNITDSVSVQAFSTGNGFIPVDTEITINGQATFDLLEGDYTFKSAAEKGYKQKDSTVISLTKEGGQKTVTLALEKRYLGAVRVIAKEGSSLVSGVRIALTKATSAGTTQEIWAYDTNTTGEVNFDVSEEGPFTIIATKEGYCDKSVSAKIGDEVILALKKFDGTCGHELKVKVIDSTGKPVAFAKVAIFSETTDDLQKLSYAQKVTDFNGVAKWNPVRKTNVGETFKVFAFKSVYSGWSSAKELNATTSSEEFIIRLDIPFGTVRVIVKDLDGDPLQFSEVQIFDEYNAGAVSGKRMIENTNGSIDFNIKADKQVYAVIKKEGYESYTTIPRQITGNGTITFEAQLSKPPVEELVVRPLGFFKNGMRAQKVEANQEYDALFEITAPKNYEELGFFVRVGKDYTTKTEMDKIFIKEVYAGGQKTVLTGGTYNKPKGYTIDEGYLNLEENKWAQVIWEEDGFVQGKTIVGVKVKIRSTAQTEERIDLGYRAWGILDGDYERDPFDSELNKAEHTAAKQALYALTKPDYITVGMETLCDKTIEDRSFCITSTYTDPEGFTNSFTDTFDSKNNTPYQVSINIMNNSTVGFDNAKIMIENPEENIMINSYLLKTPKNESKQAQLGAYKTDWIDVSGFAKGLSIDIMDLNIIPQKTGSGTLVVKIREQNSLVFEKTFSINISSDKKMTLTYMNDGTFKAEMPKVISGKLQIITLKARNASNNLEISGAVVKVFDRFGTKIFTTTTNALGVAPIDIPASFPGEKLTLKVEKAEFETFIKEFGVEEDVVSIEPTELTYTVNPQSKKEQIQTVKLTNKTGLDLTVKSIVLVGKLKGALNESKMESWFDQYIGKKILSQDFEDFDFKVISSDYVPSATDLEGKFLVTLASEGKSWVQEVAAKIRVGLGKDVDNQACLQITPANWEAQTRGNMIELGVELKNNCTVDSKPVQLKNLGLTLTSTGSIAGDFTAIYRTAQVEIGSAYARVLKPTIAAGEKIPLMFRFVPLAGSSGTATGSIVLEAQNNTDSAPQKITTEVKFNIIYENLQDCMSVGAALVSINEGSEGTFSIINSCKFPSDVQLDSGDLQAAITEKTFTLKAGETKEVQVKAQKGQIPGAYNLLVNARQKGSGFELLDNVKIIIEPVDSCFKLTRYEYDVYDSEFNNFDGVDRGYLTNSCVQKSTAAHVTGLVPFDNWQSILTSAIIGGIAGGARSGKIFPDWISNLWNDDTKDNSEKASLSEAELRKRAAQQAQENALRAKAAYDTDVKKLENEIAKVDKEIVDLAADKALVDKDLASNPNSKYLQDRSAKLKSMQAELASKKADLGTKLADYKKQGESAVSGVVTAGTDGTAAVTTKMAPIKADSMGNAGKEGLGKRVVGATLGVAGTVGDATKTVFWKWPIKAYNAVKDTAVSAVAWSQDGKAELCKDDKGKIIVADAQKQCEKRQSFNEDAAVYKETDAACPSNQGRFPFHSTDKSLGVCCLSASGPTTTCLAAKKDYKESVFEPKFVSTDEDCDGSTVLPVKGMGNYYCCGVLKEGKAKPSATQTDTAIKEGATNSIGFGVQKIGYFKNDGTEAKVNNSSDKSAAGNPNWILTKYFYEDNSRFSAPEFYCEISPYDVMWDKYRYIKPVLDHAGCNGNVVKDFYEPYCFSEKLPNGLCRIGSDAELDAFTPFKLECSGTELYAIVGYKKAIIGYTSNYSLAQEKCELLGKIRDDEHIEPFDLIDWALAEDNSNVPTVGLFTLPTNNVQIENPVVSSLTGQFLTSSNTAATTGTTSIQDVMGQGVFNVATSAGVGMFGGSALGGAAMAGLLALMQAKDTAIDYSETFFVPRVVITGFSLESQEGITLNTFDEAQKTYDFSSCSGTATASTSTTDGATSMAQLDSSYAGTVLYNPQALNATVGYEEMMELEFTNGGKKINRSPNEPFVGVLTVTGQEAIYDTDYNYDYVKTAVEDGGTDLSVKRSGIFGTILNFIGGPGLVREKTATITEDYLTVDEIKAYKKEFHLLFDSYEYVDCGPNTYPCTAKELSNCDIDGKNGYTGAEGVPKMKLAWNWSDVGINECDSSSNPENYNYCDTTQFSIMLMKRMMDMKEFFNSTSLGNCPSSAEIAGTKTQDLAENDLDVGITSVTVKSLSTGAIITATVQTNNNLEMSAKMNIAVKKSDGNEIAGVCAEQTNSFKSTTEFSCTLSKSVTGEGSFNIDLVMTPTLCSGCGNRSSANDTIRTTVIIGATGSSQCLKYATTKDYFEKVLAANNQLSTANGDKILNYISFKANLVRDAFSEDFKADFDEYLNRIANAPVEYTTGGFRELFVSDKFKVKWPENPSAWTEGKYDATIVVTFKNENWRWDNNNIESIVVNLAPQGPPEIPFAIYKVAFNGVVGLDSDNGRQGYGAGYEQITEDLFLVTNNGGTKVYATPNASNNAATTVQVSTIKGRAAFDLLNTVPTRGNVLSISGDDVVQFVLTPSIAVPLIMNITRNQSTDAYAFYSAEVNGGPVNTGGSFISWTGIGQGCVDFEGRSMSSYSNDYDSLASGSVTGFSGYGLPSWNLVQRSGTASFYGTFFAPQDASTIFKLLGANESANFESTMGNGTMISVNAANATDKIETLSDVLELVKQEKVCVVGGDYYWNNFGLREGLKASIDAKEATCIPSKGN